MDPKDNPALQQSTNDTQNNNGPAISADSNPVSVSASEFDAQSTLNGPADQFPVTPPSTGAPVQPATSFDGALPSQAPTASDTFQSQPAATDSQQPFGAGPAPTPGQTFPAAEGQTPVQGAPVADQQSPVVSPASEKKTFLVLVGVAVVLVAVIAVLFFFM